MAKLAPFDLFESLRMLFRLNNTSQTLQRLMDEVSKGLDFVSMYIDDVLLVTSPRLEHIGHLQQPSDYV